MTILQQITSQGGIAPAFITRWNLLNATLNFSVLRPKPYDIFAQYNNNNDISFFQFEDLVLFSVLLSFLAVMVVRILQFVMDFRDDIKVWCFWNFRRRPVSRIQTRVIFFSKFLLSAINNFYDDGTISYGCVVSRVTLSPSVRIQILSNCSFRWVRFVAARIKVTKIARRSPEASREATWLAYE